MITRPVTTLMQPQQAEQLADKLNATQDVYPRDPWTYKAVHCPKGTGQSFVEVSDEFGVTLGKL